MGYEKMISFNPEMDGLAEIFPDITFSHAGGCELKLHLIMPWWNRENTECPSFPLVVFVQGCGWTFPNVWLEVPQLSAFAQKGYVIALVTHRDATEGHPFPACIEDVKTAIRFLRKNAKEYAIDPTRIGLWGTSSGANISLLCALYPKRNCFDIIAHSENSALAKLKRLQPIEYADFSDEVNYIISCFPTTDFVEFYDDPQMDAGIKEVFEALSGGFVDQERSVLKAMSPYHLLKEKENITLPPIFLAHGTGDSLIPYNQSAKFYKLLKETDTDVTWVTVEQGEHEGSFWSHKLLNMIFEFIQNVQS